MPPTGLIPILATPFTSDGAVDVASLRSLTEFQLSCGVDGVAVFGMASEGFALTAAEREVILREVRAVAGSLPVVAGVNGTSTVTALEQARAAADGGADQVMVLPPFLAKPSPAQVVEFFTEVAAGAGTQVMIQDAPGVTGVPVDVAAVASLAGVEGITSIKVEAPPTPVKVAAVREHLTVLGGQNAQALIEEYDNGAVGTMPACEFSDLLRPVLDDLAAGRRAEARAASTRLLPLIHLGVRPGQAWAVHKEVLLRRGIIASAKVRLPARPLEPVTEKALSEILDELSLPAWRGGPR
ncbi:dihydrodipicolinate synthase family protein [Amycolatopsis sp.]|uniref:dihydrodipicolinate synthase family protein n=1 Tax=Amycolatopsis sp. TaxID=37632 RepID=UPI002BC1B0FA|nr:dihydrodipicolinate synthase family protein [Amycolatopsis sp.]HVV14690.1 dihydrodipicolinate synthase family protein [Amycolatopsis sp.]